MRRTLCVLAAVAAAVGAGALPASAEKISIGTSAATVTADTETGEVSVESKGQVSVLDAVLQTVDALVGPVGPGPVGPPKPFIPSLGYISIERTTNTISEPTWSAHGAFANSAWWTCTDNDGVFTVWFQVTCTPTAALGYSWDCAALHAEVGTLASGSQARTSMDCNADGTPEAVTKTATNVDFDTQAAVVGMPVATFVCRVDDGGMMNPFGIFEALCGDPGAPRL